MKPFAAMRADVPRCPKRRDVVPITIGLIHEPCFVLLAAVPARFGVWSRRLICLQLANGLDHRFRDFLRGRLNGNNRMRVRNSVEPAHQYVDRLLRSGGEVVECRVPVGKVANGGDVDWLSDSFVERNSFLVGPQR